ncbi:hypothetical protein SYNTR_1985 [Candidatus Syntrophocurvum alkaliphilum]|uniref:Methyltransferase small domain-containing protein n=1 Tax=Candidatus Syntrophocurvum alkaliphilum TaxID=2293317 RepID=A0A6I6DIT2_9FIRM|nr:tRNA1(Val) (adenine(37)-N6)-methyltransferase [Candidatus Syntrophocurvum alkaliphilum]QGU00579.1 hypothetical protein SYNTR_1985 [Candidatus Syntrophocurvum alkaliphilum]
MINPYDYLQENETLDDLLIGNKKIIQPKKGYRFSIDSVILAHFPELKGIKTAVDLGSGSGVIPIILSQRQRKMKIIGIEMQPEMVARAKRSLLINELEERIEFIKTDVKNMEKELKGGFVDLVVSNPPFWRDKEGKISLNKEEAIARHELEINAEQIITKASYLLKNLGKLAIIHRADRLNELLELFNSNKIAVKKIQMVHPFINKDAKMVLIEGQKNAKNSGVIIKPPIIIYNQPGEYTQEVLKTYYGKGDD